MSTRHGLRLLAAYLLASLTGCGGDEAAGPAAPPSASGAVVPIVCPTARYILTLSSPSATLIDEPQDVSLLINCGGNVRVEPDVAVDWSVTSGGGTVNGSTTARATTAYVMPPRTSATTTHAPTGASTAMPSKIAP